MIISCVPSSAATFVFCSIFVELLGYKMSRLWAGLLVIFHQHLQLIETLVPHLAEWLNKIRHFLHLFCINMVMNLSPILMMLQKFTCRKDLQVFRYGRACGVKIGSNGTGCHRLRSH